MQLVRGVAGLVRAGPPRSRLMRRSCCQFGRSRNTPSLVLVLCGSPGRPRGRWRQRVDVYAYGLNSGSFLSISPLLPRPQSLSTGNRLVLLRWSVDSLSSPRPARPSAGGLQPLSGWQPLPGCLSSALLVHVSQAGSQYSLGTAGNAFTVGRSAPASLHWQLYSKS